MPIDPILGAFLTGASGKAGEWAMGKLIENEEEGWERHDAACEAVGQTIDEGWGRHDSAIEATSNSLGWNNA
ncbi:MULTISPECIES: hypothetical protein [Trichocoleus]|uniref:Uncharacterized protein n=1 Tax=Trichocoleus desertorum GB2-A4 TaxID=2933944 RepID=A0ABV0J897_9CYAN|nr:hypothetical protein [Trichocoleus sp. FACHB-46]MBD1861013.1 hypothetical protein [Trichocoleus sp. FACHB-46]